MATITTITSGMKLNPDSRDAINTNFANLNTEVATLLPKSGGTMSGNIVMAGNRINGLPAPSANDEPARKTEVDGKVGLTGNETIAGTKTFSTTPVVPDASWTRVKMATGRRKVLLAVGTIKTATTYLQVGDVIMNGTMGLGMPRALCVTEIVLVDSTGTVLNATNAYVSSGAASTGRVAANSDKVTVNRNTSTGAINVKINGTNVTNLAINGSSVEDYQVTLWGELDD
ncbi:MAG: hypothetical protein ACKVRP_14625 [Bacteroidota bacterium]